MSSSSDNNNNNDKKTENNINGRKINVYIIRHGERADEVSNEKMIKNAHEKIKELKVRQDKYDPPLTPIGVEQAIAAGKRLKNMKGVNFETIYVSPFIRTLQTANEIGSILDISLTPTLGIGSCAAFVKHFGLDYILKSNYFIDKESRERLCNQCKVLDFRTEKLNFRENLERILIDMINEKNVNDNILVVTHREGIYDIVQDRKGCNVPWTIGTPEYCGCFVLQFKYIDDGKSTPYKKWRLKTKFEDFETTDKRGKKRKKEQEDDEGATTNNGVHDIVDEIVNDTTSSSD